MDAGRRRSLAWRRGRRTGADARLPALDCLAARVGTRTIGERLSGAGGYSPRWAGARPPRQLRSRYKYDQNLVADKLPRGPFESGRALELPAALRAHGSLDRRRDGLRSG